MVPNILYALKISLDIENVVDQIVLIVITYVALSKNQIFPLSWSADFTKTIKTIELFCTGNQ